MRGEQAERRERIPRGVTKFTALLGEKHNFSGEKNSKRKSFAKERMLGKEFRGTFA